MDWSYLAGFTDGEGSFNVGSHGKQISFCLTQTEDHAVVLDVIADFFDQQHISYSWYRGEGKPGVRRPYWNLVVSSQDSLRTLVMKLLPFLIVKRSDAEAVLEFLRLKDKAKQRRVEACKYGHLRKVETTYIAPNGKKACLVCRRLRQLGLDPADFNDPHETGLQRV